MPPSPEPSGSLAQRLLDIDNGLAMPLLLCCTVHLTARHSRRQIEANDEAARKGRHP